jgi:c-di-GMP-binding flagellar brake protein YcgR
VGIEKRRHVRYPVQVSAEFVLGGLTCAATTRDLSLGGVSILTEKQVNNGVALSLVLFLTEDGIEDPHEQALRCSGRVVWDRADGRRRILGVAFEPMLPKDKGLLERFLSALKASTAA